MAVHLRRAGARLLSGEGSGAPRHVRRFLFAVLAVVGFTEVAVQALFGRIDVPRWDVGWIEVGLGSTSLPRGILLQGVILGSLYGLLAVGLVLVHRTTGAINFAQAHLGAVPAAAALLLFERGDVPYAAVLPAVVASSAAIGVATEMTVVHRLRRAPAATLTVALVGVGLVLAFAEVAARMWIGGSALSFATRRTPLDGAEATVGIVRLSGDHALAVVVAVATVAGLSWLLGRTRLGRVVRAAADNIERAALLGLPVRPASITVWVVAGALSGVALLLRSPITGLPPGGGAGIAVLLPALAAAVVSGMRSLPWALAAGVGVGVVDQAAVFATGRAGAADAIVLALLLIVLLLRSSSSTPVEGVSAEELRPPTRRARRAPRGALAALGLTMAATPLLVGGAWVGRATLVALLAIVALSSVIVTGWAGQLSLGQFGLAGVGAAVAGGLAANHQADFFVTLAAAGLAGAATGAVLGLSGSRGAWLDLAVTSLALAVAVETFLLQPDYLGWLLPDDVGAVGRPVLLGHLDLASDRRFYAMGIVVLGSALAAASALRRRRSVHLLVAVRDDPRLARAQGIAAGHVHVGAVATAGAIAAVAGALLAYQTGSVEADAFPAARSAELLAVTVIGGITSVVGPILAAILVFGGPLLVGQRIPEVGLLSTGAGLLAVLLVRPGVGGEGAPDALRRGVSWPLSIRRRVRPPLDPPVSLVPPRDGSLLEVRDLRAAYADGLALDGVSLDVDRGEILSVVGPHGAGKSTLLRVVSGLLVPVGGRVLLDGCDLTGASPGRMAALGVALAPAGASVFPTLTVGEHLQLAARLRGCAPRPAGSVEAGSEPDPHWPHRQALAFFPNIEALIARRGAELSGGEQRMLSLAMAVASEPRLLLVDEPTAGLAPEAGSRIRHALGRLAENGCAVVITDHVASAAAGRTLVLDGGRPGAACHAAEVPVPAALPRRDPFSGPRPSRHRSSAAPRALAVRGATVRFGVNLALCDVDLELGAGESLGLVGPNGSGKTTLLDVVSGFVEPSPGRIVLGGLDVSGVPAHRRARLGLSRSFQGSWIWPTLTVAEHLSLAGTGATSAGPAGVAEALGLDEVWEARAADLATGTRRLVGLGMVLARPSRVMLLDEPIAGLDADQVAAVAQLLSRVRDQTGCAVIVVEHQMAMVASACERIVVLDAGRVVTDDAAPQMLDPREPPRP